MQKIIFIKYDELCLKGHNINFFKNTLIKNVKNALINFNVKIDAKYDHIIIYPLESDIDLLIYIIKRIPGINSLVVAFQIKRELFEVKKACLKFLDKNQTFKIEVKRSDKNFLYNSDQYKRMVAGELLKYDNSLRVDVHKPLTKIFIEIKKDHMIVYANKIEGAKGLPISTSGRALMLLSGGIDSPVASDILMCRGMHVDFITFITPPHTSSKALDKVKELVRIITMNYRLEKPTLYICNYTSIQNELTHIDNESYRINLLRRSFIRIANQLAKKANYDCLATGESLGQVASQTIESLSTIQAASEKIIIRPLIGYNKEQIINHAKKINTYNESIKPYDDACSLFAPRNPITKPKLSIACELEKKLDLLIDLEKNIINKIEVVKYDKKSTK